MLLELMMAASLWQAAPVSPQVAPAVEAPAEAQTVAPAPVAPTRRGRLAEGVVCETRATTGSVLRRNVCRTERRRLAEARIAKDYVGEVTAGRVTEPFTAGAIRP